MTLSVTTLSITTLTIMGLLAALSITTLSIRVSSAVMPSVAVFIVVMQCVVMLNVARLSVIMLNVVAPSKQLQPQMKHFGSKFWLHTCVSSKPLAIKLFKLRHRCLCVVSWCACHFHPTIIFVSKA